jgi:hypothetical protein
VNRWNAGRCRLGRGSLPWRFVTSNLVLLQAHEVFFGLLLMCASAPLPDDCWHTTSRGATLLRASVSGASGRGVGVWCGRRYQFRVLERRLGTAKYAAFVGLAAALAWPLRVYLLRQRIAAAVASGPYPILFAAFPLLLREIPACPTFKLGSQAYSISLSECVCNPSECCLAAQHSSEAPIAATHVAIVAAVAAAASTTWSGCSWRRRPRRRDGVRGSRPLRSPRGSPMATTEGVASSWMPRCGAAALLGLVCGTVYLLLGRQAVTVSHHFCMPLLISGG